MAWLSSRYSNNVAINLGGFYIVSVEFHGVGIFKRKIQVLWNTDCCES